MISRCQRTTYPLRSDQVVLGDDKDKDEDEDENGDEDDDNHVSNDMNM